MDRHSSIRFLHSMCSRYENSGGQLLYACSRVTYMIFYSSIQQSWSLKDDRNTEVLMNCYEWYYSCLMHFLFTSLSVLDPLVHFLFTMLSVLDRLVFSASSLSLPTGDNIREGVAAMHLQCYRSWIIWYSQQVAYRSLLATTFRLLVDNGKREQQQPAQQAISSGLASNSSTALPFTLQVEANIRI
jgi:hypothetical protein